MSGGRKEAGGAMRLVRRLQMTGVYEGQKPRGRIRLSKGGTFRAFTNKRAPGSALIGTFASEEEAGEAVIAFARKEEGK